MSENKKIIKKTNQSVAYRFGFKILQRGFALVLSVILARLLSPAEFGVVAIAKMVINYANNFSNFGFNTALIQKDKVDNVQINSVFTLNLSISLLLALITAVFSSQIAGFLNNVEVGPVLRWMSLYYLITSFYYIPVTILKRSIDYKVLSIIEFIQGILTSVFAIVLAYYSFSYWAIVIPSLIMPFLFVLILMAKTRWLPKIVFKHSAMREIYSFGLWNFIRTQLNLIVSKVDYFVIAKYLDVAALGIYEKAFEFTNRSLTGVTKPINSIYFSTFSRLKKEPEAIKNVLFQGISIIATASYPILFGIIAVAPHFVFSLLGEKWALAVIPMQLLAIAGVFRVPLGMFSSVNVAIGQYKLQTKYNMIISFVFVALCFSVVRYGIYAVTASFLVYSVLGFALSFSLLKKTLKLNVSEVLKSLIYPLAGSVIMAVIIISLSRTVLTDIRSIWQFSALVTTGGGAMFYGFFSL